MMSEDLSEDLSAPVHIGTGFEDFICETNFISNTHLLYSFGRHQRAAESVLAAPHARLLGAFRESSQNS